MGTMEFVEAAYPETGRGAAILAKVLVAQAVIQLTVLWQSFRDLPGISDTHRFEYYCLVVGLAFLGMALSHPKERRFIATVLIFWCVPAQIIAFTRIVKINSIDGVVASSQYTPDWWATAIASFSVIATMWVLINRNQEAHWKEVQNNFGWIERRWAVYLVACVLTWILPASELAREATFLAEYRFEIHCLVVAASFAGAVFLTFEGIHPFMDPPRW